MRRIIRRKKSGYALGFALFFIGLFVLFVVFWEVWPDVSASYDLVSALWSEQFDFGLGFGLKLMDLAIVGATVLVFGIVVLLLSRQIFSIYSGENVLLECPFCRNHWRASRGKGFAECPHCRQFVEPTEVKIGK